jgi:hypothetical protein
MKGQYMWNGHGKTTENSMELETCIRKNKRKREALGREYWSRIWDLHSNGYEVISSGIYRHVVRWKWTDVSEEHVTSIFSKVLIATSRLFLAFLILRPWKWRLHVSPKSRLTFNGLHGVISQKIELFRIIWNPIKAIPDSWRQEEDSKNFYFSYTFGLGFASKCRNYICRYKLLTSYFRTPFSLLKHIIIKNKVIWKRSASNGELCDARGDVLQFFKSSAVDQVQKVLEGDVLQVFICHI